MEYLEKSIVLKVLRGLSDEYAVDRKILFNQPDLSFEEVCGRLLSEALMGSSQRGNRAGQGSSQNPYPAMANPSFGGGSAQPQSRQSKLYNLCFICKEEGHISTECKHRSAVPGEKVFICYICKKPGHMSPDCPKNKGPGGQKGSRGSGGSAGTDSARTAGKKPAGKGKASGSSNVAEAMDIDEEVI